MVLGQFFTVVFALKMTVDREMFRATHVDIDAGHVLTHGQQCFDRSCTIRCANLENETSSLMFRTDSKDNFLHISAAAA